METKPPDTLINRVRETIRYKHYSIRTERAYVEWVRRFVRFHAMRHPREMGAPEVRVFLGHLASELKVSAGTHHQALSALLFLYKEVLGVELPWLAELDRPKKPKRLPVVLGHGEVERLLMALDGTHALMAQLLYGTGMRLMECVRLRVKDVDFERAEILVRDGKGAKDRVTMLPQSLIPALREQVQGRRLLYEDDLARGRAAVYLPDALERKCQNAATKWPWQ